MGVLVAGVTGSTGSTTDSDSVAHMVGLEHTEVDTSFGTHWVGTMQADTILVSVQPEPAHHSSSSRCLPSSPLGAGMLCNSSLHGLLTYKIYKKG